MQLHGLDVAQGEPAFAFCVLRLRQPTARTALLELLELLGPLIPDGESVIGDLLPEDLDHALQIIAVPWEPPPRAELVSQRALMERAGAHGVEEAWFFQTGTSLPPVDEEGDTDDDVVWSHGTPPQVTRTRFPVDGEDDVDIEDFGIAIKLAGEILPGEGTVLLAFHTLWLAPYGGRYRNASVTIDRTHHAAHFWVDRFELDEPAEELIGYLLWIVARLDEVVRVVHARFAPATMAQKYSELLGDDEEPFVLGGNPLMAAYSLGGDAAVDAWIARQTDWSREEMAQMLREIAVEIVTAGEPEEEFTEDVDEEEAEPVARARGTATIGVTEVVEEQAEPEEEDEPEVADEPERDRGQAITMYATEILRERARIGRLDARAIEHLPVRRDAIAILGAARAWSAVPSLVELLRSDGREVARAATALGEIGDPAATVALTELILSQPEIPTVAAAAKALVSCGATEPRVLESLIDAVRRAGEESSATLLFAIARLAERTDVRAAVRERLAALDLDDPLALLARHGALAMLGERASRELAALLHECLTSIDYDHESTVYKLRVALEVAEVVPHVVDPADLAWLTCFTERDVRERAHALLDRLGHSLAPARVFDRFSVRALDDETLIDQIGEARVVGRASLIAEVGRRRLSRGLPAIIDACHDVLSRARHGAQNLLDPDTRVLEVAVPILRRTLDAQVVALFDRMLRHPNYHVKWELLQDPPLDERLIAGMFHVLGEKWGWQETVAKEWLANFQGTPAYARNKPPEEPADADETNDDDQDMN